MSSTARSPLTAEVLSGVASVIERSSLPGLSLVLPAYNESQVIADSAKSAALALEGLGIPYEIIVVDDGSTDDTLARAREAARETRHVRVISTPENVGYGGALRFGFREARFELLSFTDADGQFDLRELSRLLARAEKFDLVCGYRIDRQDHWTRKLYSRGYNLLVRSLLGTRVRDCDCALKIFRRNQIHSLELESDDFFINAELLAKARLAGLSVTEVGVSHYPRRGGESKVSIWHTIPVFRMLLLFWWSRVLFSRPETQAGTTLSGRTRWVAGILLAVVASVLLLPNRSFPLVDPDESRYAEISRQMLESGDLLVPTHFGKPYLDKPPLLYWLTVGSFQLFGVSESAARLVPALAALLTIMATYFLGARLVGRAAAWLGSLAMLSCCGFLLSGRFVFIDTLLALCTTVALLAGRIACRRPAINLWWWSISAMACGLGVLAKGPVAVVLCVPPLLAGRWLTGCGGIRIKQALAYAGIVGLVSVPWFLLVNARQSGFLADFFWTHHFNRFVSGLSHAEPWWYYLPVLLVGMLPCSILFPAIAAFLFDRGNTTRLWRSWDIGFLALASGWTLLTFSLASCKLPPYLLPAVPAICLIVGRGLEAILSGKLDNRFLYFVRQRSPHHLIGILLSAGMICGAIDLWILEGLAAGRGAHWAILVLGGTAAAIASWKGLLDRRLKAWAAAGVLAVVSMAAANLDFYPGVATKRSKVAPVVDLCHSKIDRSTPVVCFSLSHEADSMAFRLGGCQLQNYEFSELDAAVSALSGPGEFIVLANTTEVHVLRERLPAGLMLAELGQYEHIFVGVCSAAPQATARR